MYNLGEQFKMDMNKAIANPESVFKGSKYRITILTERLVRLEYNEDGFFNDNPTELIFYRNLPKPNFTVSDTNTSLKIVTNYFELTYRKEKKIRWWQINAYCKFKNKFVKY